MSQPDEHHGDAAAPPAPIVVNTLATFHNSAEITSSPQAYFAGTNQSHAYGNTYIHGGRVILGNVYGNRSDSSRVESLGLDIGRHGSRLATSLFLIPRPSTTSFTGRTLQMNQLNSMLVPDAADIVNRKVVVIHGLGGSGKTQFCLKYAEENKSR